MPIADREERREYQRTWASRRKRELIQAPDLRNGFITWDDLNRELKEVQSVKTHKECVAKARSLIAHRKTNRLAVAILAEKSCTIKHGGNRRSKDWSSKLGKTCREFAIEIGLNPKTLNDWVRVKTMVIDHLPHNKPIDWQAARLALNSKKSGESLVKTYERYSSADAGTRGAVFFLRYLRGAAFYSAISFEHLNDAEKADALMNLGKLSEFYAKVSK